MIRVMLVDDEPPIFRYMKKWVEELDGDFRVVGEAFDGKEAFEKYRSYCRM